MTMFDAGWFRGRAALVTGASSGVGHQTALALGRAGAVVGAHYRSNKKGAEEVQRNIESAGGRAVLLRTDVSKAREVERMFAEFDAASEGRLDMLVNNAGEWMDRATIADCPEAHWDKMQAVNLKSVFLCCQQAARRMTEQGEGVIVNLGSVAGHTGGSGGTVPYAAAKAGVHTLTRGLAKELAPHGVRVNAVAPGLVDTPMLVGRVTQEQAKAITPMGRMARPEEIASVILMVLSPACAFMTGEIVEVNGGLLTR